MFHSVSRRAPLVCSRNDTQLEPQATARQDRAAADAPLQPPPAAPAERAARLIAASLDSLRQHQVLIAACIAGAAVVATAALLKRVRT